MQLVRKIDHNVFPVSLGSRQCLDGLFYFLIVPDLMPLSRLSCQTTGSTVTGIRTLDL